MVSAFLRKAPRTPLTGGQEFLLVGNGSSGAKSRSNDKSCSHVCVRHACLGDAPKASALADPGSLTISAFEVSSTTCPWDDAALPVNLQLVIMPLRHDKVRELRSATASGALANIESETQSGRSCM